MYGESEEVTGSLNSPQYEGPAEVGQDTTSTTHKEQFVRQARY
jgi:hypothetical protein